MQIKELLYAAFTVSHINVLYGHGNVSSYQQRRLIIYSPDSGKPRKQSEEAFITLINQDHKKTILIQLSVDVTESGFSFSLQVF